MDKLTTPTMYQLLTLSMAHMTPSDDDMLRNGESRYLCAYNVDYGHLVWVPEDLEIIDETLQGMKEEGMSKGLIECMKLALDLDCRYIRFDCDEPPYEGLPDQGDTWEWSEGSTPHS